MRRRTRPRRRGAGGRNQPAAAALARLIGPGYVLGGPDYPHAEGLIRPVELGDELTGVIA